MRRNARSHHHADDYPLSATSYQPLLFDDPIEKKDCLSMERLSTRPATINTNRFENTIETKVESGDTLQAIALRFHCTVGDIKRLNKIDKDNEIHARKVVKIPVNVHNVLLDNLPIVHKSGNNSPKPDQKTVDNGSRDSSSGFSRIIRNPLEDAEAMLSEKLMVASVNSSGSHQSCREDLINNIPSSKLKTDGVNVYTEEDLSSNNILTDATAPLILDDSTNVPQMHRIRGPSLRAMDWSGSDCDMSWVCLFVVILALCFVIPLVYVFYIAEHSHHNTTGSSLHH